MPRHHQAISSGLGTWSWAASCTQDPVALLFPTATSGTLRRCSGSRRVWSSLYQWATEATVLVAWINNLSPWPVAS